MRNMWLGAVLLLASLSGKAVEFLPVDQAFQFNHWADSNGFFLTWQITPGHYLYQQNLKLQVEVGDGEVGELEFNTRYEEKYDENFEQVMQVVYDKMEAYAPIYANEPVQIKLTYQGCAEAGICYPPVTERLMFTPEFGVSPTRPPVIEAASADVIDLTTATIPPVVTARDISDSGVIDLTASNRATEVDTESSQSLAGFIASVSLWQAIGLFFLLGIGLTFTPCVLPMIPILSSIIMGQGNISTKRAFLLSLTYVVPMALTFALAGLLVATLGARYNLAAMMQQPIALSIVAAIFVLLALVMFDKIQLRIPFQQQLNKLSEKQKGGTFIGVAIMGVLSAVVVSPCVSAPLAGALIYISSTGDMAQGFLALFALGMGMGVPLLIVGTGGNKLIPRAGAWMNIVKSAFGILLLAIALYLITRLLDRSVTLIAWGAFGVITLVMLGALEPVAQKLRWLKALGVLALLYSAALLFGGLAGNTSYTQPLKVVGISSGEQAHKQFIKVDTLAEVDQIIASSSQPVMLDYWADWCVSCYTIEEEIFADAEVQQKMANWTWVQIDVTENDADDQAALERFGLFGPPAILFFDPQQGYIPELTIQGELSKTAFLNHLGL
ncbi:protein-disulfide reductase DsbD [Salinibius halmophilus]|uniref:protein-disulfide reductase DsbD n=1 Tax=Salinibius halmophilus TaxID=1853216 RepID=UPI000E66E486|nr:protein-disulfide reductase DsbD [Salinibius halmophilus]